MKLRKIYEASGEDKRCIIELDNDYDAFEKKRYYKGNIDIREMMMVGRTDHLSPEVDLHWSLNGLIKDDESGKDIIIMEPFESQVMNAALENISETDTYFSEPIKLSKKSLVLMPVAKYDELCQNLDNKKMMKKMNVRLYEGEEDLAVKMIFRDKRYVYIDTTKDGYVLDSEEHIDAHEFIMCFMDVQEKIVEELQKQGRNVTYRVPKEQSNANKNQIINKNESIDEEETINNNTKRKKEMTGKNFKMITGLCPEVEGDIELGEDLHATTDIGKMRNNQEDAVLLIKDDEIPDFKMLVVADGMGGWSNGEVASDVVVEGLKDWFEKLENKEECFQDVSKLKDSLDDKILLSIQSNVQYYSGYGGSTLVCAIIGKNNTLISNIGDSRAYITQKGKLKQISREDTVAEEHFEKGETPTREATRFDQDSNQLTQCLGMNRCELKYPHSEILDNKDYEMILLFSDGVTDCLSDEDIAIVCRNTDKKELASKIVEKALRNDSFAPQDLVDEYIGFNIYIPGGKDNATAAVYSPIKEDNEKETENKTESENER